MAILHRLGLMCFCVSALFVSAVAHAFASPQDPPGAQAATTRRWEIAIHVGGIGGGAPPDGSGQLPAPRPLTPLPPLLGELLPTAPSWFFGEPAQRLNASFAMLGGFRSLDPVLLTAGVEREGGADIGVKVSRQITGRLRVEAAIDRRAGQLTLTRETLDRIEASRASFARLFRTLPIMASADAAASIRERGSSEIVATGALAIDLLARGRAIPFVVFGAGLTSRLGDTPSVALRGEYVEGTRSLPFPGSPLFQIAQTDNVTIRYDIADRAVVGVMGGGVRYALSPRWVATLDMRVTLSGERYTVSLDADPTTAGTVPGVVGSSSILFFNSGVPPIRLEFNTDPTRPASLSDPALQNFVTFTGSGVQTRFGITVGVGWRF